jgi:hypothetical protein
MPRGTVGPARMPTRVAGAFPRWSTGIRRPAGAAVRPGPPTEGCRGTPTTWRTRRCGCWNTVSGHERPRPGTGGSSRARSDRHRGSRLPGGPAAARMATRPGRLATGGGLAGKNRVRSDHQPVRGGDRGPVRAGGWCAVRAGRPWRAARGDGGDRGTPTGAGSCPRARRDAVPDGALPGLRAALERDPRADPARTRAARLDAARVGAAGALRQQPARRAGYRIGRAAGPAPRPWRAVRPAGQHRRSPGAEPAALVRRSLPAGAAARWRPVAARGAARRRCTAAGRRSLHVAGRGRELRLRLPTRHPTRRRAPGRLRATAVGTGSR